MIKLPSGHTFDPRQVEAYHPTKDHKNIIVYFKSGNRFFIPLSLPAFERFL